MKINHKKNIPSQGFTLVEMLVVMAILATLAAIAFPVTSGIINKGKITETGIRMQEFETAVNAFQDDHGHLPHAGTSYPNNDEVSQSDSLEIVTILLNMETGLDKANDTGKKYLLMQDAKSSKNGVLFSDDSKTTLGKSVNGEIIAMADAWGNPFVVLIDYDLDSSVLPSASSDTVENKLVILGSAGPDGDLNTDDDIYSWK